MKKMILALMLTTALATVAKAQQVRTCVGGTEFQGAINGHYYCRGPAMTWWAAFAWCQKQGRHLASLDEACGDWRNNDTIDGKCLNMKVSKDISGANMSSGWIWTATPYTHPAGAYLVNSGDGGVFATTYGIYTRSYPFPALCN